MWILSRESSHPMHTVSDDHTEVVSDPYSAMLTSYVASITVIPSSPSSCTAMIPGLVITTVSAR